MKFIKTVGHHGTVEIFIKKRLFGFLWYRFVLDQKKAPIVFNKMKNVNAYMNGEIKYREWTRKAHSDCFIPHLFDEPTEMFITHIDSYTGMVITKNFDTGLEVKNPMYPHFNGMKLFVGKMIKFETKYENNSAVTTCKDVLIGKLVQKLEYKLAKKVT